ncbi:hypothetical protein [Tateyamaria sp.]|uniref:hypothetical protein n=1 Tax=Tateyamaria sp. TaxID=1929288 RepID=UPI00329AEFDF
MEYLDIAPSFFEDHRQFFESIAAKSEHGEWSTRHLCDDFACLVTTRHPPAFVDDGELIFYSDKPYLMNLEFWSLSRNFTPNESFDDEDVDIAVSAYFDSYGKWQFGGQVRLDFLINNASAELERQLLNAASKFGDPASWVHKTQT